MKTAAGPAAETKTTHWVEVELVDHAGKGLAGEPYQIELPDGSAVEGNLDSQGRARVEDIDPGNCKISFPNLDKKSWRKK